MIIRQKQRREILSQHERMTAQKTHTWDEYSVLNIFTKYKNVASQNPSPPAHTLMDFPFASKHKTWENRTFN